MVQAYYRVFLKTRCQNNVTLWVYETAQNGAQCLSVQTSRVHYTDEHCNSNRPKISGYTTSVDVYILLCRAGTEGKRLKCTLESRFSFLTFKDSLKDSKERNKYFIRYIFRDARVPGCKTWKRSRQRVGLRKTRNYYATMRLQRGQCNNLDRRVIASCDSRWTGDV